MNAFRIEMSLRAQNQIRAKHQTASHDDCIVG